MVVQNALQDRREFNQTTGRVVINYRKGRKVASLVDPDLLPHGSGPGKPGEGCPRKFGLVGDRSSTWTTGGRRETPVRTIRNA